MPQHLPDGQSFAISQLIALSIKHVLDTYVSDITVKWPNDIYWRTKKICGILIENKLMGHCIQHAVIGVGVNLNQTQFRSDAPNPVSLAQITGDTDDRGELVQQIRTHFHNARMQ